MLLTLAFLAILHSCVDIPTDPLLPNWDIELNLPLTEKSYTLDEVVTIDENISVKDTNGVKVYQIETEDYEETFTTSEFLEGKLNGDFDDYSFPIATGDTVLSIPLSSGALIDTAHLKSGNIRFSVTNTSGNDVNFTIEFPGLTESNGDIFTINYNLSPGESILDQSFNISDFRYSTAGQDNADELLINVFMVAQATLDEIELNFSMLNTDFYFMKGVIPTLELDPIREGVELPLTDDTYEARDKLFLKNAKMFMRAEYSGPIERTDVFDVEFGSVQIVGMRKDGSTFNLTDAQGNTTLEDIRVRNGVFEREFNNGNSNIADFLSFIPDSIIINAGITMNPESEAGSASDQDEVLVTFSVEAITELTITGSPFEYIETIDDDTKDELDNEELDNVIRAEVFYEIDNGIPLALNANIEFRNSFGDSLFAKDLDLEAAEMSDNLTVRNTIQNSSLELDSNEISMLDELTEIVVTWTPSTNMKNTDPPPYAYFGPDQSISMKTWMTFEYHIDLEEEEK